MVGKSGLGKAIKHQMKALDSVGIKYTTNPKEDYDILHINTYFPKSYFFAKKAKKNGFYKISTLIKKINPKEQKKYCKKNSKMLRT